LENIVERLLSGDRRALARMVTLIENDIPAARRYLAEVNALKLQFARLAASGLRGHEYAEPHMYFGGVGAAQYDVSGLLQAFGDPRRTAAVGVTPGPPG